MPLIGNVFSEAARLAAEGVAGVERPNGLLVSYAHENFGVDIRERHTINAEDLLTNLELEYERFQYPEHLSALESAIRVIESTIRILEWEYRLPVPHLDTGGGTPYHQLAKLTAADERCAVVRFNWDTLFDDLSSMFPARGLAGRGPERYLKLHGSIGWRVCQRNPACKERGERQDVLTLLFNDDIPCRRCSERTEPLIVPPVSRKVLFQSEAIRKEWHSALELFPVATDLVVWGYSLPESDFAAKWLFRKVDRLDTLTIINPDQGVVERFESLFPPAKRGKVLHYPYFEDFYKTQPAED